jgi:thimet oligopeptidase
MNFLLRLLLLPLALYFPVAAAAAPDAGRALIPVLSADEIAPRCERELAGLRRQVEGLEQMEDGEKHYASKLFQIWNRLQVGLEDLQGPVELLNNVSPDPRVRGNAEPCIIDIHRFATDIFQNEDIYRKIKEAVPADQVQSKLRRDILDAYEDAGVSLTPKKRERMKEIISRLAQLGQEFARNVRDNNKRLSFAPEEMKGLPSDYLANAKRDGKGNYSLGFTYPEYQPFMQYADSGAARRRYQFEFVNRGTPKNPELLKEAITLRHEMAGLFGYGSYAEFALRRRMAKTPAAVDGFLNEVQQAVTEREKKELDELRAFKAQALNLKMADSAIERWDVSYWQEKLKQSRYHFDQNEMRKYFPTAAAMPWIMDVSGRLYDIDFRRAEVPVWHKDVEYYDVIDKVSSARIGGVYIDIFPREGKYGHAAAFGVRGASTLEARTPVSVLVANFNREGLDGSEIETLTHEFGHLLHGVLSKTRYVDQAGTSVERDFVEAPSQMYEEWARRMESLSLLPEFCPKACPAVDDDLLQRMENARKFGRGIRYARQILYARYDMALHGKTVEDPLMLWQQMEAKTPLGYVPGTEFPGQFSHLMGGYAAGYYGYLWSEVLALDMLSRYDGKLMNSAVGGLYRKTILERGSELRGRNLVRSFLGREPNSKAFYDEIAGQRVH